MKWLNKVKELLFPPESYYQVEISSNVPNCGKIIRFRMEDTNKQKFLLRLSKLLLNCTTNYYCEIFVGKDIQEVVYSDFVSANTLKNVKRILTEKNK